MNLTLQPVKPRKAPDAATYRALQYYVQRVERELEDALAYIRDHRCQVKR